MPTKKKITPSLPDLRARSAPIIERAPLPIVEVQGSKHIVSYVNSAFCSLLEKPRKDLIGKPFRKIVPGGDECVAYLDRVYQTGEAATLAKEDESEPAHWLYAMWPALDEKERPSGVIIQLTKASKFQNDVTDINAALLISGLRQHELTAEAEHLNALLLQSQKETQRARDYAEDTLRTAPIPLIILRSDLRVNTTNEAFCTTFQVERGEAAGKLIYDLGNRQWNIPELRELLENILPKNKIFNNFEVTHEFESIGRRTMLLNARRMENETGEPLRIVLAIEDITARKQAEEALREAQLELRKHAATLEKTVKERTSDLQATNEQLAAFVYSIAHDLRAPLRSMQGFSQVLLDDYASSLDETARNFLQRIRASSEFMDKMIMDLLAFGGAGRTEIKLEAVPVRAAWESAVFQYATQIEQVKAQIETVEPLPSVRANEATLAQILANLLSNALKFVPDGTPPKIRFRAEDRGEMVRLWMEDNGVGIPTEYQERVFRVFERLNGARFPGTGIGLSIVRKGVERMGGKVGLESERGKGSQFWIELQKASG